MRNILIKLYIIFNIKLKMIYFKNKIIKGKKILHLICQILSL